MLRHCPNPDCAGLARDGVVAEFRDTVETCVDCGATLASGERPANSVAYFESHIEYLELVTIFVASDLSQGQVVASAIDAAGIPVFVKGELLQGAVGELPATVGQVEIQVPVERTESAREIAVLWEGPAPTESVLDEIDDVVAQTLEDELDSR